MGFLTDDERDALLPAEMLPNTTPIPTQIISNDEYIPAPQSEQQKQVEARLLDMGDEIGKKQGLDRREFFQTAAGMAAAFVAMNDTFGVVFDASKAEAATPAMAQERADALKDQFIMDMHTHFLRDDTRIQTFVRQREAVGKAGWNPALVDKPQTIEDLKWNNYFKEVFLDSDTKIALISSAPSDIPQDWFLTNDMTIAARDRVNKEAGSKRMMAHAIFTPGQPGWLESLEHALSMKPDSIKGYTIGDNTNKDKSQYPWRMDDEKVTYRGYELAVKPASRTSACTRACSPRPSSRSFPICSPIPTCATWARRPRTGRSSISSSITPPIVIPAAAPRQTGGTSSSRPGAAPGSAIWPRFRRSSVSPTSTATSAKCSRRAWWPSRGSVRR